MDRRTGIITLWSWALSTLIPATVLAAAPPELTGTWEGKLAVDPKTSLTVQFKFTKAANGSYTAVLNSPDNTEIKNTAANNVSWDGSNLKLQVPSLSGAYSGILKNGKIGGQWTQPGATLSLDLVPFTKPVMSKSATETLTGTWTGPLKIPGGELTFVLRFKKNETGEVGGTLAVPEQGGREIPMTSVEFSSNKLTFKVPQVTGDFSAVLANGMLNGTWKQGGGNELPVTLKKGEFVAAVRELKLSPEAFAVLKGNWKGKLEITPAQGPKVAINLVLRFTTAPKGEYIAFLDSPDQNASDIPVTEASFADGKLTVKIASARAEFSGSYSDNNLTGEWKQGTRSDTLILTKK